MIVLNGLLTITISVQTSTNKVQINTTRVLEEQKKCDK